MAEGHRCRLMEPTVRPIRAISLIEESGEAMNHEPQLVDELDFVVARQKSTYLEPLIANLNRDSVLSPRVVPSFHAKSREKARKTVNVFRPPMACLDDQLVTGKDEDFLRVRAAHADIQAG